MNKKLFLTFSSLITALLIVSLFLQIAYGEVHRTSSKRPNITAEFASDIRIEEGGAAGVADFTSNVYSAKISVLNRSKDSSEWLYRYNTDKVYISDGIKILFRPSKKDGGLAEDFLNSATDTVYFFVDESVSKKAAIAAIKNCEFEYMFKNNDQDDADWTMRTFKYDG